MSEFNLYFYGMKLNLLPLIALLFFAACKKEDNTSICANQPLAVKFDSCRILCNAIYDIRINDYISCGNNTTCFNGLDTVALQLCNTISIDSSSACFTQTEGYRYSTYGQISAATDVSPAYTIAQIQDSRKRSNIVFDEIAKLLK